MLMQECRDDVIRWLHAVNLRSGRLAFPGPNVALERSSLSLSYPHFVQVLRTFRESINLFLLIPDSVSHSVSSVIYRVAPAVLDLTALSVRLHGIDCCSFEEHGDRVRSESRHHAFPTLPEGILHSHSR